MAFTYGTVNYCTSADGSANNIYQVRLGYELQSQDTVNNTSTYKLQLEARSTDSRYKPYGYNQTTTIDGTTYSAKTFDFRSTNTWQVFGTKTLTNVSHNADGTYSVSKSGSFTTSLTGGRPKNGSASVTVTLPTIPRASSITVSDANIGSATNIVINKASSGFTTTLYYKASGQNSFTKIVDKTANQVYGWTVPTSFYSLIPNQRNITCQFYAETYSGSTLIGTSSTVTATFKANVYPTINSITKQTTDQKTYDLTGNRNTIIKGVSTLQIQVNASAGTGASIDHYVIGGVSQTSNTRQITQASSNTYSVSVYDTRGEPPTTQSITMPNTMINYVPLTISANIRRNQPTDGIVKINLSGNYFNDSFGAVPNTLTVEYRYKVSGASSWDQDWTSSGVTVTKSGNTYTATKDLSGMTYTNSYQFEVRATDQVGTQTITGITVTKGEPVYWWDDEGLYVNGVLKVDDTNIDNIYLKQSANVDSSKVAISMFNSGGKLNNAMQLWSDSTTSSLDNFKNYVLSSSVSTGTTLITCWFNGSHVTAIVEKANTSYLSFVLFSYALFQHHRYYNGTWYDETIAKLADIPNTYYTGETAIGKWIDNKTIYRKVLNFTTSASDVTTWTQIAEISSSLDNIINIYGYTNFGGNKTPIPRYENTSYYLIFLATNGYLRYRSVGFNSANCYLVVEYTKSS